MPDPEPPEPAARARLTLALCTLLHAFTHAYGTLLVPLYLLMAADLRLGGAKAASFIVTIYGLIYCLGSYGAGVLADRYNRKWLLGIGLLGNAAAILGMGLTRRYDVLIALGVLAGVFGTLFHPTANALTTAHFPKAPGMAIGLLGIGAGLGFFVGPQYAGWRAEAGRWQLPGIQVADWQRPCVELGAAGLLCGVVFLLFAGEARRGMRRAIRLSGDAPARGPVLLDYATPDATAVAHPPLGRSLRWQVVAVAIVLGSRDFAGVAGLSLASIYLQRAREMNPREAGFVIGTMMLLSVVVNPIAVYLTPGRRRLPALSAVLVVSGCIAATVPFFRHALPVLCAFQTLQLTSYAISDAAILERVAPAVRGRVVGLFLTIAGTFASTGPWVMGAWTDGLGLRGHDPSAYFLPFGVLGGMMALAGLSPLIIARMGRAREPVDPLTEVMPATVEVVG